MLLSIISSLGTLTFNISQLKPHKSMLFYTGTCGNVLYLSRAHVTKVWFDPLLNMHPLFGTLTLQSTYRSYIESTQKRAARFCLNNFSKYCSVSSLQSSLGLPSLWSTRKKAKLVIPYKLINSNLCIPADNLSPNYPSLRSGYYQLVSFFPSTIKLWNSLLPL